MKLKLIASSLILSSAILCAAPASAKIIAQRNCTPANVNLPTQGLTTGTSCTWDNTDNDMQITFHGSENATKGYVQCVFKPAIGSADAIKAVVAKKAADVSGVNYDGNNISFFITAPSNGENANVLFYLNKMGDGYTPGDQMTCIVEHR